MEDDEDDEQIESMGDWLMIISNAFLINCKCKFNLMAIKFF